MDRFGIGYRLLPPTPAIRTPSRAGFAASRFRHGADALRRGDEERDAEPDSRWLVERRRELTVGVGNGLFSDDGGLGARVREQLDRRSVLRGDGRHSRLAGLRFTLLAEHNAWDFNVGASAAYRGIRAGLYVTELGAGLEQRVGDGITSPGFYNYRKVAFTLGWQSNILALLHGDFLQKRADRLARERAAAARRHHSSVSVASRRCELELDRYEAQNLLELEQRRAAAEVQLRQERKHCAVSRIG